jgi:hypothetical protein
VFVVFKSFAMDGSRFDAWSRAFADAHSRRGLTRLLAGLALGGAFALRERAETAAKHKRHKKRHRSGSPLSQPAPPAPPPGPTCRDKVQNGAETDVDCGGPDCPRCLTGQHCATHLDCATAICTQGVCHDCLNEGLECGADFNGDCACDRGNCTSNVGRTVTTCADCVAPWVCLLPDCYPPCGSSESCAAAPAVQQDACRGNTATCGRGGQCFLTVAGEGRCGIPTATGSCGCRTDQECAGHGAGAFCVRITGTHCTGCASGTFCATPA